MASLALNHTNSPPTALDRLLSILGPRAQDQPLEHITSWILAAAAGGHFDAYDYLVGACGMADLAALRRGVVTIAALPSVCAGVLPPALRLFRERFAGIDMERDAVDRGHGSAIGAEPGRQVFDIEQRARHLAETTQWPIFFLRSWSIQIRA